MAHTEILCERIENSLLRITMNRPEKRNAITPTMLVELTRAIGEARDDAAVRAVLLAGAGPVFCAGGDLGAMAAAGPAAWETGSGLGELFLAMAALGKPTIAVVHGHAMGGGLGLVAACDLAVASNEAKFAMPEILAGLWPMTIMEPVVRNVPRKRALELMLTGERIDAQEALRIGLVSRVAAPDAVEREALELGRALAAKSATAVRLGLRAFYETQDMEPQRALPLLKDRFLELLRADETRAALRAILEKRGG